MADPVYKESFTPQDEMVNFNRLKAAIGGAVSDIADLKEDIEAASDDIVDLKADVTDIKAKVTDTALILSSSTEGSTKKFSITVDDDGELTATEVTEET